MIAKLGMAIFLVCNEPVMIAAEMGGETRLYEIKKYHYVSDKLHFTPKHTDLFYGEVFRRLKAKGMSIQMQNRDTCET